MTISNHFPLGEQLISEADDNPFAEFMWMENEDEFDRQVEEELWEQEFIESCFNQMLEEEQWEWFIPSRDLPLLGQELHSTPYNHQDLQHSAPYILTESYTQTEGYYINPCPSDILLRSSLNPNAKEFTPGIQRHVM